MMLTREDCHDLKNQLAIAFGMTEMTIRALEKKDQPLDVAKAIERQKKVIAALEKVQFKINEVHEALKGT